MRKGESGTNNLLDQQISANLQQLLVWHSGDYDGFQSQRSGVQIQVSAKKKNGGLDLRLGLGLGGYGTGHTKRDKAAQRASDALHMGFADYVCRPPLLPLMHV